MSSVWYWCKRLLRKPLYTTQPSRGMDKATSVDHPIAGLLADHAASIGRYAMPASRSDEIAKTNNEQPGLTAAVSQNLFGASSGAGPYCGRCLKLNAQTNLYNDQTIASAGRDVVVMVDNLCPRRGQHQTQDM